jgi:putative oxidoreductase
MGHSRYLLLAALFSFAVALLHVGAIFAGPDAYAFLGAPDLGALEAEGSWWPDAVTLGLVGVFGLFGWYALPRGDRLPLRLQALLLVGAVYALRGLVVFPQAFLLARGDSLLPPRYAVFSLVSLLGGCLYLRGAIPLRRSRLA